MLLQFAAYFVYYTDLTLNPNIIILNKVCDIQNKISKALVQVFAFYRISRILDVFSEKMLDMCRENILIFKKTIHLIKLPTRQS